MARKCKQLLDCGGGATDDSIGIEVVVVESLLEFPVAPGAVQEPPDVASMSCFLVNLDRTQRGHERMLLLASTMRGVRVRRKILAGPDRVEQLRGMVLDREDDFSSAVVILDDGARSLESTQSILNALRAKDRDTTGVVVAVSEKPGTWGALQGVDGYVFAEESMGTAVGCQLFIALATMTAPHLLSCIDGENVRAVLFGSECPSRLIEATWVADRGELAFQSESDERVAFESLHVIAFIFVDESESVAGFNAMRRVCSLLSMAQTIAYQVAVNFVVTMMAIKRVARVTLICVQN